MRGLILLSILALVCVVCSTPIDPKRWLINRPTNDMYRRTKRATQFINTQTIVRGRPTTPPSLRKGEYMCGSRICKLKPGEVPKGCNGLCQYPV